MYLLLRGSCCGCYFSHLSCLYCYTTVRLIIKALLTTTLGVVSLLQETEPLFLWKLLFPINYIVFINLEKAYDSFVKKSGGAIGRWDCQIIM